MTALILPREVLAQTITLDPDCGQAGVTSVKVKGSGWTSKFQDPENYTKAQQFWFFFDGQEIGSRQNVLQDNQQPSTFFLVPFVSAGQHSFRIELRYCPPGPAIFYRRQCVEIPFRVVTQEKDPWESGFSYTGWSAPLHRGEATITFNPTDVCAVDECPTIYFIQTVRVYVTQNGNRRVFRPVEKYTNPVDDDQAADQLKNAQQDSIAMPAGMYVDGDPAGGVPYYNTGPASGNPGSQTSGIPVPCVMMDSPHIYMPNYFDLNITKFEQEFEVNAFCASGPNARSYLGRMNWKRNYVLDLSAPAVEPTQCTPAICTQGQPSADFLQAVELWSQRTGFQLPAPPAFTADQPRTGGTPCRD